MIKSYFVILICIIGSLLFSVRAQTLKSDVSQSLAEIGQVVTLRYKLNHPESGRFIAPDFKPFKVISGPSQSSSIRIINGVKDSEYSWSYQLLVPDKPGNYIIPKASIDLGKGKKIESDLVQIEIIASPVQQQGKAQTPRLSKDKPYWIALEVNEKDIYTGQMVIFRCKLYSTVELSSIELIQVPTYDECSHFNRQQFDNTTREEVINGKRVLTKVIQEVAVAPQKPGEIEIGPYIMRVTKMGNSDETVWFPFTREQNFETISSNVVTLKVKALPQPIPAYFMGGVGQFESNITFNPPIPQNGKTLQARLTIRGTGDIKRIQAPDIQWPESFDLYDVITVKEDYKDLTSSVVGEKTFDYILVPREVGKFEIETPITYFSTEYKQFKTLNLKSKLDVKKGVDNGEDPEILSRIWDGPAEKEEEASFVNRLSDFQKSMGAIGLIGLLSFILMWYLPKKIQENKSSQIPFKQMVIRELTSLAKTSDKEALLLHLQRTIYHWVVLEQHTDLAHLDRKQVLDFIDRQEISSDQKNSIKEFLEISDASLYMPAQSDIDFKKIVSQAIRVFEEVLPNGLQTDENFQNSSGE